jgi:DNA-binding GntR family transcriptional regulator
MSDTKVDPASPLPTIALLQAHSLSGVVQHEIERAILSGELPAGTRLNENALAGRLGVSRGPVREACRALAELGLVQLVPNRGVFVTQMHKGDAEEVYDLRAGLTAVAASLLAAIVADDQIAHLRRLLAEMAAAAEIADFSTYSRLNAEFHDYIVRSTGNRRLTKAYRDLLKEFQLFRMHGLVQKDALLVSHREHQAIVDALESRDGRRSYDASFQHVSNGKQRMLAALAGLGGSETVGPAHLPEPRSPEKVKRG